MCTSRTLDLFHVICIIVVIIMELDKRNYAPNIRNKKMNILMRSTNAVTKRICWCV